MSDVPPFRQHGSLDVKLRVGNFDCLTLEIPGLEAREAGVVRLAITGE